MLDMIKLLQQSNMLSCKGFSIATDVMCQKIMHNPVSARFFRIQDCGEFLPLQFPSIRVIQNGSELFLREELPIIRSAWYGDEITGCELEFVWQDGVSRTAIWSTSPLRDETGVIIGAIATFEEVTELINSHEVSPRELVEDRTKELKQEFDKRVQLKREVAKIERLNVIGQLAADLAHEVRNPITTIREFLQLLQNKTDLLTYKSYFNLMIEELDRTNSIIREFLSLTKTKPVEMKRQNLNDVLVNLFPLIQADAFSQDKQFIFGPGDIADLYIDSNEITQLVLNFARNGLEAMHKNLCLTIITFMDEQNIVLSVKDEGTGIKPEDVLKLGTPFFTTKENGAGLGLQKCYSIAEKHCAQIEVKTSPEGTTFLVRFPKPKEMNIA